MNAFYEQTKNNYVPFTGTPNLIILWVYNFCYKSWIQKSSNNFVCKTYKSFFLWWKIKCLFFKARTKNMLVNYDLQNSRLYLSCNYIYINVQLVAIWHGKMSTWEEQGPTWQVKWDIVPMDMFHLLHGVWLNCQCACVECGLSQTCHIVQTEMVPGFLLEVEYNILYYNF